MAAGRCRRRNGGECHAGRLRRAGSRAQGAVRAAGLCGQRKLRTLEAGQRAAFRSYCRGWMNGLATSILGGIDDVGRGFVSRVYMQLGYALGNVYALMLTVYIIWWGYSILSGRETISPIESAYRLGRAVVIYLLLKGWGTFSETIYKLVQAVPSEIGKIIVGAVSRATGNQLSDQDAIPALIDNLYRGAQDVANQVYSGTFYDIFGALLSTIVLLAAIIFSALAIAAIIAAKIMLFITLALAPVWIVLWLYRWSTRMSEGFISLTTYLIIQQILIYGFLGFYFSLVNLALNTATSGGASVDNKMSMVLPLVLVTIIGIYVLMQIPAIASILNGGGYLSTVGAYRSYGKVPSNVVRYSGARFVANRWQRLRSSRSSEAARSSIQQATRDNARPLA
ncbi:type IV secretion system protein [Mesorhizobium sp.]|uniref:type IV secretion system protein n=1 Tax=Mesorhizobium sp. TaxID=1871066 RepID=UPI0025F6E824|nr:type IV secretion system protein [Mesorhizobium sp.]